MKVMGLTDAHDIIICTEAWGKDSDLEGYKRFSVSRPACRNAGGVAVYVAMRIMSACSVVRKFNIDQCGEVIWLRIKPRDPRAPALLLGACYFAPEASHFHNRADGTKRPQGEIAADLFAALQAQLVAIRTGDEEVLLAGDFNARLSSKVLTVDEQGRNAWKGLSDVLMCDPAEGLLDHLELPGLVNQRCSIPEARASEDMHTNEFGVALAALCRDEGLGVLNGRIAGDPKGRLTFPVVRKGVEIGGSTIDLYVGSSGVFNKCIHMSVWDLQYTHAGEAVGDHRPVTLVLAPFCIRHGHTTSKPICKAKIDWNNAMVERYKALFADGGWARPKLAEIENKVRGLVVSCTDAVTQLTNLLRMCMQKAWRACGHDHGCKETGRNAPWWTDECGAHQGTVLALTLAAKGKSKDGAEYTALREARRRYNRVKREAKAMYEHKALDNLIGSCANNPRKLWRLLKGDSGADCALDDADEWRQYFDGLYNDGMHTETELATGMAASILNFINDVDARAPVGTLLSAETVQSRSVRAEELLNQEYSTAEVAAAIAKMGNNKSCGPERAPSECYKKATYRTDEEKPRTVNALVPVGTALLERIRSTGEYPAQFEESHLTPVYKRKGEATARSNYRGIAVGGTLAKCYAALNQARLAQFGAATGGRHGSQAAFRAGYSTTHHLFALRHLTHKHSMHGQTPLFVCQIDFEKAFDKVPRWALWKRLEERGVCGTMMQVLQKSYEKVCLRAKVNGNLSEPFASMQGVKQGCPKSTDLFGIFIECLADYVDAWDRQKPDSETYASAAPVIGGKRVTCLLYADDLTLCALSIHRMQFLLNRLHEFCIAFGMRVNITKCEMLVFAATPHAQALASAAATALSYGPSNIRIPIKGRARYLGLHYGPATTFDSCYQELVAAGRRAAYALTGMLSKKQCLAPGIMHSCFEVQVRSVLSYGVEIWGPDALLSLFDGTSYGGFSRDEDKAMRAKWRKARSLFDKALTDPMVTIQTSFLARAAGASRPTHRLLYAEFATLPLQLHWARLVFGFWNRIIKHKTSLAHTFMEDAIEAAVGSGFTRDCWVSKVYRVCKALKFDWHSKCPEGIQGMQAWLVRTELPVADLLKEFTNQLMHEWTASCLSTDPRGFPETEGRARQGAPGVKMCRYVQWMGLPQADAMIDHERLAHMRDFVAYKHLFALIRFRLGCWDIEANRPVHNGTRRARSMRWCRVCGDSKVEDEKHVLLECSAYDHLRAVYGIAAGASMKNAMLTGDVRKLAAYLYTVQVTRTSELRRR